MNENDKIIILENNSYKFTVVLLGNIKDPHKCLIQIYVPINYKDFNTLAQSLLDYSEFYNEGIEILQAEAFTIPDYINMNEQYKIPHPKFLLDRFSHIICVQAVHLRRNFYGQRNKVIGINSYYNSDYILDIRRELLDFIKQFTIQGQIIPL